MNDFLNFMRLIRDEPGNAVRRAVFADWLEEHGEEWLKIDPTLADDMRRERCSIKYLDLDPFADIVHGYVIVVSTGGHGVMRVVTTLPDREDQLFRMSRGQADRAYRTGEPVPFVEPPHIAAGIERLRAAAEEEYLRRQAGMVRQRRRLVSADGRLRVLPLDSAIPTAINYGGRAVRISDEDIQRIRDALAGVSPVSMAAASRQAIEAAKGASGGEWLSIARPKASQEPPVSDEGDLR